MKKYTRKLGKVLQIPGCGDVDPVQAIYEFRLGHCGLDIANPVTDDDGVSLLPLHLVHRIHEWRVFLNTQCCQSLFDRSDLHMMRADDEKPLAPEFLQKVLMIFQGYKVGDNRFVSNHEISFMHGSVYRGFDALFKIGDEIPGIPTEGFVAPLSAKHNFAMSSGKPGYMKLRKGARSGHRVIKMIDYVADRICKILLRAHPGRPGGGGDAGA